MKIFKIVILFSVILSAAVSAEEVKDRDELYQVSVLSGLMKGDYDGKVTLDEIRKHGDFGFGTFDRLDGEAIELDGVFYQVRSDGTVRLPAGSEKSPFAMATFFDTDMEFPVTQGSDYGSLRKLIDSRLPTRNIPYAVRIDGKFSYVKARSVPAQNKPYPPLAEVVKNQSIFEFRDIEGTLMGFRIPDYMQGVNMPGYHMHFLSRDKTKGGHVLECAISSGKVKIDNTDRFAMALSESADFNRLDFSSNVNSEAVEASPQTLTQDDVNRLNAMEIEYRQGGALYQAKKIPGSQHLSGKSHGCNFKDQGDHDQEGV
jgi:acetolactate decarboxylase